MISRSFFKICAAGESRKISLLWRLKRKIRRIASVGFTITSMLAFSSISGTSSKTESGEANRTVQEALFFRNQALAKRNTMIANDPRVQSPAGRRQLYLDAVYDVFFSNRLSGKKDFREWLKTNRGLISDPDLPSAVNICTMNIKAQILLLMKEDAKAAETFMNIIQCIASASPNLAKSQMMQESLQNSLLVRYYKLDNILSEKEIFPGTLLDIENLFLSKVATYYEKNAGPDRLQSAWETVIAATARLSNQSIEKSRRFQAIEYPRLLVESSDSLLRAGNTAGAMKILKRMLLAFPEYPRFDEAQRKYLQLANSEKTRTTLPQTR